MSSTDPRVARPANADAPVIVTITWDEASHLWHTGAPQKNHRTHDFEHPVGRYSLAGSHHTDDDPADRMLVSPAFADGSLLWTDTYLDALTLAKVHVAYGYEAHVFCDEYGYGKAEGDWSPAWVVLTSWDCMPQAETEEA